MSSALRSIHRHTANARQSAADVNTSVETAAPNWEHLAALSEAVIWLSTAIDLLATMADVQRGWLNQRRDRLTHFRIVDEDDD